MKESYIFLLTGLIILALFIGGSLLMHATLMVRYEEATGVDCLGRTPVPRALCMEAEEEHWLPRWPGDYLPVIIFGGVFGGVMIMIGLLPAAPEKPVPVPVDVSVHEYIGSEHGFMMNRDQNEAAW